jgi:hypothetical protein
MRSPLFQLVIVVIAAASLDAQWLKYPTPNVPRTADGNPNLNAPAPRMADGKPDFSGIWQLQAAPCPPAGCGDYPAGPEFLNFGARLKGGLPYQPWAAALVKERTEQFGRDDPVGFCKPGGALRLLLLPDLAAAVVVQVAPRHNEQPSSLLSLVSSRAPPPPLSHS